MKLEKYLELLRKRWIDNPESRWVIERQAKYIQSRIDRNNRRQVYEKN